MSASTYAVCTAVAIEEALSYSSTSPSPVLTCPSKLLCGNRQSETGIGTDDSHDLVLLDAKSHYRVLQHSIVQER